MVRDPKKEINDLVRDVKVGRIPAEEAWDHIKGLKVEYVEKYRQQSWNVFIGNKFEEIIHATLKVYVAKLIKEHGDFKGLTVLTGDEAKSHPVISRKLAVRYGDFLLLPDVDSVIVWLDLRKPRESWESEVIAIASCKTSLRERIAQACYWKLKLLSTDVQKGIRVFLATADNDEDFFIKKGKERYEGKSRDRVIAEYELDGVYILRSDFEPAWQSHKVKRLERILEDLIELMRNRQTHK